MENSCKCCYRGKKSYFFFKFTVISPDAISINNEYAAKCSHFLYDYASSKLATVNFV